MNEMLKELITKPDDFVFELIRQGLYKSDGKYLYKYEDEYGFYKRLSSQQEETDSVHSLIKPIILSKKDLNEILYYLRSNLDIRIQREDFNKDAHRFINCKNGVIDTETLRLLKHSPNYMFNYCNYANFITGPVKADAFDSYCQTSLEDDKGKKKLLLEMIGYTLSPTNKAKKACFIIGPKHCGKSTMQNVLISIIGRDNVGSIALQDMSNRFSNSMLSDVRVNMQFELSNKPVYDINDFKAIVGGDYCAGEKKGGALYTFRHTAKLLFGGNHLPPLHNPQASEIYVDRIALLKLNKTIEKRYWDLSLESKLLAEKDKIFTLSMQAYHGLYKNRFNFSIPEESKRYLREYQLDLDNVRDFFNQTCKYSKSGRVHSRTLYDLYVEYCKDNAIEPFKKETFSKQLAEITEIQPKSLRINGSTVYRGFEGIELIST